LNNLQDFVDLHAEPDQTLKADGFDAAIIGIDSKQRMVYSIEKILAILIDDDMNEEDALEHFYYNIAGSYVGDYTPIYIWEYHNGKQK
tara:strand:+ start:475 stop:738 length:264 start_codon:yes stop_codon:yes gene_type:complete